MLFNYYYITLIFFYIYNIYIKMKKRSRSPPRPDIARMNPAAVEEEIRSHRGYEQFDIPMAEKRLIDYLLSRPPMYDDDKVLAAKWLLQDLKRYKEKEIERVMENNERAINESLPVTRNTLPRTRSDEQREAHRIKQADAEFVRKLKEQSANLAERKRLKIPNYPITPEQLAEAKRDLGNSKYDLTHSTTTNPDYETRLGLHQQFEDKVGSLVRKFEAQPKNAWEWGPINPRARSPLKHEEFPAFFNKSAAEEGGRSKRSKRSKSKKHSKRSKKTRRH
jgi:hypothetical protein